MKILIWSQNFWPESFRINEVVQHLTSKGHEITVLTGKPNYPEGKILQGFKPWRITRDSFFGTEVIRIPLIPRGRGSSFSLILNYLSFLLSGYLLSPFALRSKQFDVVFVYAVSPILQAFPAAFIARRKKAKLSIWLQDLWPDALEATGIVKSKFVLEIVNKIVKHIYNQAHSILIQSKAFQSSVEVRIKEKRPIVYLPNLAMDFSENLSSSQKALTISKEVSKYFSLVFAGNIGRAQSVETIVLAATLLRSIPDIKFYLIGGGPEVPTISKLIKKHKLNNVIMIDRLPYSDMRVIFSAASGLILSLRNHATLSQTIPSKLQDYFSAGKPILGTLEGQGAKLIREAKAGMTCSAENPNRLAKCIQKLYALSPQERDKLGHNGRQFYEANFLPSKVTSNLIEHLESLTIERK